MFVYSLVLVSVVQVVWTQSCIGQSPCIFVVGNALGADETCVNFWWSSVIFDVSGECNEEEYDCRCIIPP